tara:strand:+ start:2469 stop:2861 length:393 start_codon:yes stop_codon:yes gene_type:complete
MLAEFLVKAKKATYASGKTLTYKDNQYSYKDTYYGSNPFGGQEIVSKDKPIWIMNYWGKTTNPKIYKILKQALLQVTKDLPFRGPRQLTIGPYLYKNEVKGSITSFHGKETIEKDNKIIYTCFYHGGEII